jgi:hypothetical protein
MKEQHGVGHLEHADGVLDLLPWGQFVILFVQLNAQRLPVYTGAMKQFAEGVDEKEANLK